MNGFYEIDANKSMLLYTNGKQILLRNKIGETISRPSILAHDYFKNLSHTIYNGTIYFTYLNKDYEIILKSLTEPNTLYKIGGENQPNCLKNHMVIFQNKLFIFYITKNLMDNSYSLKCCSPFDTSTSITIPESFPILPSFDIFYTSNYLILSIYTDFTQKTLQINKNYQVSTLGTASDFLHQEETHNKQLLDELNNKIQKLIAQIHVQSSTIQIQEKAIQSAATQYNELMKVAEQYRQEAIKWRNKLSITEDV